ncbi:MAG: TonB family protein [Desulfuromusa sp.]|nr:TonB family protein [Desulfuromusa sp.]
MFLTYLPEQSKEQTWQRQPTIVRLVEKPITVKKPQVTKKQEFEIDQQPVTPEPEVPVESFRKAERDQKVEIEQAPKGDDVRDQTTKLPTPPQPKKQKQQASNKTEPKQQQIPKKQPTSPAKDKLFKKIEKKPAPIIIQPDQPEAPPPTLSMEQLRPDSSTLDQIASGSQANRNRIKERKDVEIGDTVWLDLQSNLLVSFFRRFHDQVELVWNYPTKAAMNGIEGTLELLIIVNQKGELIDVDLIQTSGSDLLDFEAIQAVYRGSPFGPLTKYYPHEELKIRAHFRYQISGQFIYGR